MWRRIPLFHIRSAAIAAVLAASALVPGCGPGVAAPAAPPPPAPASSSAAASKATPNPSRLHMVDGATGWGDFSGSMLRTTDGGRHWADVGPQTTGGQLAQPGYFLDAEHAWILRYSGYSGGPWQSATDTEATVLRTADGGATWRTARLPLPGPVSAQYAVELTFLDARHGWAMAHVDTALHPEQHDEVALFSTSDGGATWQRLQGPGQAGGALPAAGWKVGLVFRTPQEGWITGQAADGGQLLYVTHNGGRSWSATTLALPATIAHAVHGYTILPPQFWGTDGVLPVCAFVTGYWPTLDVFRTTDGGATWTGGAPVQANTGGDCIHQQFGFTDPQHGWFMDDTAYAFTTGDGGATWTNLHPTTHYAQVNGIDFVTQRLGWGTVWQEVGNCSGLPAVVQTSDGGMTWQVIAPPPAGMAGVPHSCPAVPRSLPPDASSA